MRSYSLSSELVEEKHFTARHTPHVSFLTYKDRVRLGHRDVEKSLDKEFGHKSVWSDDDGVWVEM